MSLILGLKFPRSGFTSPDWYQGSSDLVVLQYGTLQRLWDVLWLDWWEVVDDVLALFFRVLQSAEQVVILVGGKVVLGLVPVRLAARRDVRAPCHVLQQSLPVGEHVPAPNAGVQVDTAPDEVDHLHLQRKCLMNVKV